MRSHHTVGANPCGVLEQQFISGLARTLLDFGPRVDPFPNKNSVRKRKLKRPAPNHFGLASRMLAQTMIDRRDANRGRSGKPTCPLRCKEHQRDRSRAARNREKNPARALKWPKQPRDGGVGKQPSSQVWGEPYVNFVSKAYNRVCFRRCVTRQHCARLASRSA